MEDTLAPDETPLSSRSCAPSTGKINHDRILIYLLAISYRICGGGCKIQSYFQHKPPRYRKCDESDDVDEEDDDHIANPGNPSLGGILKQKGTLFEGSFKKVTVTLSSLYNTYAMSCLILRDVNEI